jgi:hypothetical protein
MRTPVRLAVSLPGSRFDDWRQTANDIVSGTEAIEILSVRATRSPFEAVVHSSLTGNQRPFTMAPPWKNRPKWPSRLSIRC